MQEWQKILISTLAGFVAALVAEPIKTWMSEGTKRRHMRVALYRNLIAAQRFLRHVGSWEGRGSEVMMTGQTKEQTATEGLNNILVEVYEHYYDKEKALFYSLPEAIPLLNLFGAIQLLRDEHDANFQTRARHAKNIAKRLDSDVEEGTLNRWYLYRAGYEPTQSV